MKHARTLSLDIYSAIGKQNTSLDLGFVPELAENSRLRKKTLSGLRKTIGYVIQFHSVLLGSSNSNITLNYSVPNFSFEGLAYL